MKQRKVMSQGKFCPWVTVHEAEVVAQLELAALYGVSLGLGSWKESLVQFKGYVFLDLETERAFFSVEFNFGVGGCGGSYSRLKRAPRGKSYVYSSPDTTQFSWVTE